MSRPRTSPARDRSPLVIPLTSGPAPDTTLRTAARHADTPHGKGARIGSNEWRAFPSPPWTRLGNICFEPGSHPGRRVRTTMPNAHLHAVTTDPPHLEAATDVVLAPLLDLDPDLAAELTPALREQVRGWLVVRVWSLPRGAWPTATVREPGLMGFLVLDGVLTRNVSLGKIAYPELLGRGDLLRPWQNEPGGRLGPVEVTWQVLEPCRVAVLDRRFAGIVGRWPEIVDELLGRALNRARELDFNMAIAQLPLLELRLLALLWRLADRWGEPVDSGVCVPIRLTHSLLAAMVLGRRPSVSSTLTELAQRGLVSRTDDGWILHGDPPTELHKLSRRDVHGGAGANAG
jgi:CRP-like cAMP-binding protein